MSPRLIGLAVVVYFSIFLLLLLGPAMVDGGKGTRPAPAPVGVTTMPTPDPARYR